MLNIQKHLNLLGLPVKDRVTGFTGIVVSVGFDLFGCVQAVVNPGLDKDSKIGESMWFDVARLKATSKTPAMPRPEFEFTTEDEQKASVAEGRKGPAAKPAFNKH